MPTAGMTFPMGDHRPKSEPAPGPSTPGSALLASRSLPISQESLSFAPMEGTRAEAEAIAQLFGEARGGPVEVLTGP